MKIMDCYIVRIYRRITSGDKQGGEIAGLVERVGDAGDGVAFSSYQGLVNMLRNEPLPEGQERPCAAATQAGAPAVTGSAQHLRTVLHNLRAKS
jgi:hypothetical protein